MRYTEEKSINNYRKFINEFYNLTKNDAVIVNAIEMCRAYHVSNTVMMMLQKKGFIKKYNMHHYKWVTTVAPNNRICDNIRKSVCNYHSEMSKNIKERKDKETQNLAPETSVTPITSIPKMKAKKKTFSFLWGLIKFDY